MKQCLPRTVPSMTPQLRKNTGHTLPLGAMGTGKGKMRVLFLLAKMTGLSVKELMRRFKLS